MWKIMTHLKLRKKTERLNVFRECFEMYGIMYQMEDNITTEIRQMGYNGYTEKKKVTNKRYLDKLASFIVRVEPGEKEEIEKAAAQAEMSRNAYVLAAVREKIAREKERDN
ncbi:MAG: hypothetical protein Q4C65_00670 [Eubacteriales bacterium]|nr:hypothetical protein [Eubacteriales bacterium]